MKTTDEIKKGLACCIDGFSCRTTCPYTTPFFNIEKCTQAMASDALALIQQLEAQVPHWISVEERLPEEESIVLVHFCTHVCAAMYLWQDTFETLEGHTLVCVTHWMPLPEPPET